MPAVNVSSGKAAAIAKSDEPKWDVKFEPFHMFKRRVTIWAESHCIEHLLTRPPAGGMSDFECHNVARRTILLGTSNISSTLSVQPLWGYHVMKLMRKHRDLYDFNLGPANRVGHAKHCTGCLVANKRLGARAAYNHCLTKVATSPGECYFADVAVL